MKAEGKPYRTIWLSPENSKVINAIDQRVLPHKFLVEEIRSCREMTAAIKNMHVRGAGLTGAAAGYGMYLACLEAPPENFDQFLQGAAEALVKSRPTAVNLKWAVERQLKSIESGKSVEDKTAIARKTAESIANEDAEQCRRIGEHGLKLIEEIASRKKVANTNEKSIATLFPEKRGNLGL